MEALLIVAFAICQVRESGKADEPKPLPEITVINKSIVEYAAKKWKLENKVELVDPPDGVWLKGRFDKSLISSGVDLELELKTIKRGDTVILRTDIINYRQDLCIYDLQRDCEDLGLFYVIVFVVRDPPNDVYTVPLWGDEIPNEKVFKRGITYINDASRCKQLVVCSEKTVNPGTTPKRNERLIRTIEALREGRETR